MTDNKLISRALAALRNVKRSEIVFVKSLSERLHGEGFMLALMKG
jgi:hypothetical protein